MCIARSTDSTARHSEAHVYFAKGTGNLDNKCSKSKREAPQRPPPPCFTSACAPLQTQIHSNSTVRFQTRSYHKNAISHTKTASIPWNSLNDYTADIVSRSSDDFLFFFDCQTLQRPKSFSNGGIHSPTLPAIR